MQLPSRAEILILCAAVIHRFSWSLFRMMVTALKLTTVRSSIQWNFPFFFSFGITFWSAAWQCVITILFRMPSENLVDLFTYKNYVVYLSLIYFGTSFTWWHQSQHYPAFLLYSKLKGWTTHSSTHLHAISPLGYQLELFFFTSSWTVVLYSLHIYVQCHSV